LIYFEVFHFVIERALLIVGLFFKYFLGKAWIYQILLVCLLCTKRDNDMSINVISELFNDSIFQKIMAEEREVERLKIKSLIFEIIYSQYSFSIIYHPQQKNILGVVDSFQIEGGDNAQFVLDLKTKYNVGISQIRISKNGKRIRTINLKGNEVKSLNFKSIRLF